MSSGAVRAVEQFRIGIRRSERFGKMKPRLERNLKTKNDQSVEEWEQHIHVT
jgi:hypothetical protein